MRELSLHILDIAQNSIAAGASLVTIRIDEEPEKNLLTIMIGDNGHGIPGPELAQVTDPFFTSRTTREVGLGLALFAKAAETAQGEFWIDSKVGTGTQVTATFRHDHLDRAPLGDLAGTLLGVVVLNPSVDVVYQHNYLGKTLCIDTRQMKRELGTIAINHPAVISWLEDYIRQEIEDLYGGD